MRLLHVFLFILFHASALTQSRLVDVLVIGGVTAGVAAGIQSARKGVKTLVVEETPWLGGMISSASVSAFDGNHLIPSGIWRSFRNKLYSHYGGVENISTGWVSNTLFEPHIADSILNKMPLD
jgi:NADPH-dependent 2,4-dienoyl-CoA reductase/sulfur reductase-like enzyme